MPAPDPATLQRFLLGQLPADEAATVEAFLDTHPEAAAELDRLRADDSLTSALRGRTGEPVVPREAEDLAGRLALLLAEQTRTAGAADSGEPTGERTAEDLTAFLSPPQSADELGRLGDYRILRVLGQGGMAVVFEAEDTRLGRRVAVKAMLPRIAADPLAKGRFVREAKAAAAVEHDHVVPIHHIAEAGGVPYIVMPFLKGESLDERLKRDGTLPIAEVLRIGREVAEGLAAAHAQGLVHRDIKPGNLWLEGRRGRVKILDFGLARPAVASGPGAEITQSGAVVGTPAYMSPEQGRGLPVDFRTDLFSLGGVLYRACTGRTPFQGPDVASILMALAADTPEDPRKLNPTVPPGLSMLIRRLLEKEPARRPASAADVARQLAPAIEPLPSDADGGRPESDFDSKDTSEFPSSVFPEAIDLPEPAPARSRRGRWIAAAVAVLVVGITLFFAPTIIRVATNQGVLVVEVEDPTVIVEVKTGTVQVLYDFGGRPRTVEVEAGRDGTVEVRDQGSDVVLVTEGFKLTRGGKTIVTVKNDRLKAERLKAPAGGNDPKK
jgi:serine/threonine protein kinase